MQKIIDFFETRDFPLTIRIRENGKVIETKEFPCFDEFIDYINENCISGNYRFEIIENGKPVSSISYTKKSEPIDATIKAIENQTLIINRLISCFEKIVTKAFESVEPVSRQEHEKAIIEKLKLENALERFEDFIEFRDNDAKQKFLDLLEKTVSMMIASKIQNQIGVKNENG